MKGAASAFVFIPVLLIGFPVIFAEFQTRTIFPTHAVAHPGPLPPGSKRLKIAGADGHALHGVHVPPIDESGKKRTLIVGFGGNAWNAEDVASYLHEIYPQADIVTFHYRGYAPSCGRPSADALVADAPLVLDAALKQVPADRVVAVGFSIGSGFAASLAARSNLHGMILVTPFDSLKAVAQSLYAWVPIGPFFEHDLDAAGFLHGSPIPVAMVAAEHDEIIPSERTEALRERVSNLVFDRTIARSGHNDIYQRSDFHAAMREALRQVSRK